MDKPELVFGLLREDSLNNKIETFVISFAHFEFFVLLHVADQVLIVIILGEWAIGVL